MPDFTANVSSGPSGWAKTLSLTSAYLPIDRRSELATGRPLPQETVGSALFADISGFTLLADALKRALGARRGAEELAHRLNLVFDALITQVERYGGSVISFSGDAITCWYDAARPQQPADAGQSVPPLPPALRAVASALAMQQALHNIETFEIPGQGVVRLRMKVAIAGGPARRWLVGDPQTQIIDVIAGKVMERMAAAESLAERDEILIDENTVAQLGERLQAGGWREVAAGQRYMLVQGLAGETPPQPWPEVALDGLDAAAIQPWLLPDVYERLKDGLGEFLTELRPTVAFFLSFGGIDYEADPQAQHKLDRYVLWVQAILRRYEGALLQFTVGDKGSYFYASFGAPVMHEDDALRAVNAALELCSLPEELSYIQAVAIGINQGTMHAGAYGSRTRRTYGVLGDDTNLAARLMQVAASHAASHAAGQAHSQILVSGAVVKAVGPAFLWEARPPLQVKGKAEPVEVAVVVSKTRSQPRTALFTGKIFGRQAELDQLLQWLSPLWKSPQERATAMFRQPGRAPGSRFAGVMYVVGEAGVGKSRLVYELRQQVGGLSLGQAETRAQWFECLSEPILRQSLNPFKSFLYHYFEQSGERSEEENKERFDEVLDYLLARLERAAAADLRCNLLRSQLERTRSMLGALVDLFWPDSLYERLEPKLRFENTLQAFKSLLLAESLQRPLVLHIEDVHWLDDDSQALLKVLVSNVGGYPFAVLLSGRSDEGDDCFAMHIDAPVSQQTIELKELPQATSRLVAQQALSGGQAETLSLSDDLAGFLVEKTGGNPLFLENLALELRQRGLVRAGKAGWVLLSAGLDEVPATLNALLISQLDRLEDHVRSTVQTASVLGNQFEVPVLQLMQPEEANLFSLVRQAEQQHIWLSESELRYLFRHTLLRDAAYDMQPQARQQELHAHAARAIQECHAADLAPYFADLAHHFILARNPSLALAFARLAGERAAASYLNRQAIEHYRQALESAALLDANETLPDRLALHLALGELLVTTGQRQPAQEHLEQAIALAEASSSVEAQGRACYWLARLFEGRGEYPAALQWIERGLTALGEQQIAMTSELLSAAGLIYSRQGDYTNALEHAQRCLRIAQASSGPDDPVRLSSEARATNLIGHINRLRGESAAAIEHFQRSLTLYQLAGDISGQALSNNQIANACFGLGRWQKAAHHFSLAREIFDQLGDIYNRAFAENNLGWIALNQGRLDEALDLYQLGLSAIEQIGGSAYVLGAFHNNLGATYIRRGEAQAAQNHLQISQSLFEQAGARDWLPELYRHQAAAALLSGDWPAAQQRAAQALELARQLSMRGEEGIILRVLGEIAAAQGQIEDARRSLTDSLAILTEVGDEYEQARSQITLARLLTSQGDASAARRLLESCIPVLERLGASLDLSAAHQLHTA